jgi:hypothetical protein
LRLRLLLHDLPESLQRCKLLNIPTSAFFGCPTKFFAGKEACVSKLLQQKYGAAFEALVRQMRAMRRAKEMTNRAARRSQRCRLFI